MAIFAKMLKINSFRTTSELFGIKNAVKFGKMQ